MKTKDIEKQVEQELQEINALKILLGKKKAEIKDLKEEIEGHKQVNQILNAIIVEGIVKKEEVCIPIDSLSKGLKTGYKFDIRDGMYIITKRDYIPVGKCVVFKRG